MTPTNEPPHLSTEISNDFLQYKVSKADISIPSQQTCSQLFVFQRGQRPGWPTLTASPPSLLSLKSRPWLFWATCLEGSGSLCTLAALSCLRSAQPPSPTASRPACPSACSAPGVLALSFPSTAAALRARPSLPLFVDLSPAPRTVSGTQSGSPPAPPPALPKSGECLLSPGSPPGAP